MNGDQLLRSGARNLRVNPCSGETITPEAEGRNLCAGLVALTFAVENHLSKIMQAVWEGKG